MNLINALIKSVYLPFCRAYSRSFVRDKPADFLLRLFSSLYFWRVHGYWPQLRTPRSFEEKVTARMLFDRDPKWTLLSDKLRVRDYVEKRAGKDVLIPLLWSGTRSRDIPFDTFPDQFVIKANHGCGYNIIVSDISQFNTELTKSKIDAWLNENFCHDYILGTAWAYRNISPSIIVESFIGGHGKPPVDYKFFCFDGKVEMFKMDFDRFTDHSVAFFDRRCQKLDVHEKGLKRFSGLITLPDSIHEMIEVAERLATGLDFIRVDLYNNSNRTFFGELTCYPSGGNGPWVPESFDFNCGAKWKLAPFTKA
jgi:hypothetical protein